NLKDYSGYVFFVWPRDLPRNHPGNSTVRPDENGEVAISGFNPLAYRGQGVFLFAVPKKMFAKPGDAPKDEWFDGTTDGVLKSGQLASPVRSVAENDPRSSIVNRYRIEIKDGKLTVTEQAEKAKPKE